MQMIGVSYMSRTVARRKQPHARGLYFRPTRCVVYGTMQSYVVHRPNPNLDFTCRGTPHRHPNIIGCVLYHKKMQHAMSEHAPVPQRAQGGVFGRETSIMPHTGAQRRDLRVEGGEGTSTLRAIARGFRHVQLLHRRAGSLVVLGGARQQNRPCAAFPRPLLPQQR